MRIRIRALYGTILVVASACASAERPSYDTLTQRYRTSERARDDSRDEDVRALAGDTLERAALIRAVLDCNPTLESARQAWRAALGRYREAGAYEDPVISAAFAPLAIGSEHALFGYNVGISQAVPLGGKLGAEAALAAAETEAAASDYEGTRLGLALVASDLYDDYLVVLRSLDIQAEHVALMRSLAENAVARYESGHAEAQDSLAAESEIVRLEDQVTRYETQRDVVIAHLNLLLHRAPELPLPKPPSGRAPVNTLAPEHRFATEDAIARRPDVASARARIRVARARVKVAGSAYYPDLTLSASYNSMWDMPEHRFMVGIGLNVPLQLGRRAGASDAAAAQRAVAEQELLSRTDLARSELAIAARQIRGTEQSVEHFERRLVPVARARIETARAAFIASRGSFTSVLEAERGLRSAQLELELARADLNKRRAALERALGRIPGLAAKDGVP